MRRLFWPGALALVLVVSTAVWTAYSTWRLPIGVVRIAVSDDSGPVAGARVIMSGLFRGEGGRSTTDSHGIAVTRIHSSGMVEISAEKEGYYDTLPPYNPAYFDRRRIFSWEPRPLTADIVMRKIGAPLAMYAKDACAKIDTFNHPRGYDLIAGDWVAPYGSGRTNDFILEILREIQGDKTNETMRLTFSNPGDGIQPYRVPGYGRSRLFIPALAPPQGYRSKWVVGAGSADGENKILHVSEPDAEVDFYFRVRTRADSEGHVVGGLYGKIREGIFFSTAPDPNNFRRCSPGIYFTYFLNPDGTRNTEYSGQNLLQGEGTDVHGP